MRSAARRDAGPHNLPPGRGSLGAGAFRGRGVALLPRRDGRGRLRALRHRRRHPRDAVPRRRTSPPPPATSPGPSPLSAFNPARTSAARPLPALPSPARAFAPRRTRRPTRAAPQQTLTDVPPPRGGRLADRRHRTLLRVPRRRGGRRARATRRGGRFDGLAAERRRRRRAVRRGVWARWDPARCAAAEGAAA